jgi:hypothetical protein
VANDELVLMHSNISFERKGKVVLDELWLLLI